MRTFDTIVIGGGIHGACSALRLAQSGASVALVERAHLGGMASGVNAGSVHHIPRVHFELPIAELALRDWPAISDWLDDDCGFARTGFLRLIRNGDAAAIGAEHAARTARHCGIREAVLDRDELRRRLPGVAASIEGALYAPDCGYASPAATLRALRSKMSATGVTLLEGCPVDRIDQSAGTWTCTTRDRPLSAKILLNCAGAWGDHIAALAGDTDLPVKRQALTMSVTDRLPPTIGPVVGVLDQRLSLKQAANGTVIIGGGYRGRMGPDGRTSAVDWLRLSYNLALALDVLPQLGTATVVRSWTGIEGFTADEAAYVGPSPRHAGLWHCFGFSAHGFYLGPTISRLVVQGIRSGTIPELLQPYDPARVMARAA